MEHSYIKEGDWIKCTIDGITYDCYVEYGSSLRISKPWVTVTVRKYITKKWWFFKWREEEFECKDSPDLHLEHYRPVNGTDYFKSEYIKELVKGALARRETERLQENFQKEEEKRLNVIKEI